MKSIIRKLLREGLDKTIKCSQCDWSWKESETDKKDMYVCHKCGHDNSPKKESLNETILTKDEKDIKAIADFINFAKDYLKITDDVKIKLAFKRIPSLTTTAYYDTRGEIMVYAKDRAIIDVCRSICHELVHHKQNLDGRLTNVAEDGADGSEIENEANAVAGEIIRKFGKLHPDIYK
jgi:hypothetical protein